jgi:hypothetical protein
MQFVGENKSDALKYLKLTDIMLQGGIVAWPFRLGVPPPPRGGTIGFAARRAPVTARSGTCVTPSRPSFEIVEAVGAAL